MVRFTNKGLPFIFLLAISFPKLDSAQESVDNNCRAAVAALQLTSSEREQLPPTVLQKLDLLIQELEKDSFDPVVQSLRALLILRSGASIEDYLTQRLWNFIFIVSSDLSGQDLWPFLQLAWLEMDDEARSKVQGLTEWSRSQLVSRPSLLRRLLEKLREVSSFKDLPQDSWRAELQKRMPLVEHLRQIVKDRRLAATDRVDVLLGLYQLDQTASELRGQLLGLAQVLYSDLANLSGFQFEKSQMIMDRDTVLQLLDEIVVTQTVDRGADLNKVKSQFEALWEVENILTKLLAQAHKDLPLLFFERSADLPTIEIGLRTWASLRSNYSSAKREDWDKRSSAYLSVLRIFFEETGVIHENPEIQFALYQELTRYRDELQHDHPDEYSQYLRTPRYSYLRLFDFFGDQIPLEEITSIESTIYMTFQKIDPYDLPRQDWLRLNTTSEANRLQQSIMVSEDSFALQNILWVEFEEAYANGKESFLDKLHQIHAQLLRHLDALHKTNDANTAYRLSRQVMRIRFLLSQLAPILEKWEGSREPEGLFTQGEIDKIELDIQEVLEATEWIKMFAPSQPVRPEELLQRVRIYSAFVTRHRDKALPIPRFQLEQLELLADLSLPQFESFLTRRLPEASMNSSAEQ